MLYNYVTTQEKEILINSVLSERTHSSAHKKTQVSKPESTIPLLMN